jgi:hypothetical protein
MQVDGDLKLNHKFGYVAGVRTAAYAAVAYPAMVVFLLSASSATIGVVPGGHTIETSFIFRYFFLILLLGIWPALALSFLFICAESIQRLLHRQGGVIPFLAVSILLWFSLFVVLGQFLD